MSAEAEEIVALLRDPALQWDVDEYYIWHKNGIAIWIANGLGFCEITYYSDGFSEEEFPGRCVGKKTIWYPGLWDRWIIWSAVKGRRAVARRLARRKNMDVIGKALGVAPQPPQPPLLFRVINAVLNAI